MREDMKAFSILGLIFLVLIVLGAPLVNAAQHLPTIHCWDGTSIDPVNGTYVAHCSPAPVCPHGTSPYPDATGMNQTDIEVSKILSDYWQQNYPNGTTVPPA